MLPLPYYCFQLSSVLNLLCYYFMQFSLSWLLLKMTDSAVLFSSLISLSVFLDVYAGTCLGYLGDRYNKVGVTAICHAVSVVSGLAILAIYLYGLPFSYLLFIFPVLGLLKGIKMPIENSIIKDLVKSEKIPEGVRVRGVFNSLGTILGPMVAAVIVDAAGVLYSIWAFIVVSIFNLAFLLLIKRKVFVKVHARELVIERRILQFFSSMKESFQLVYRIKTERYIAVLSMLICFSVVPYFSILMPYKIVEVEGQMMTRFAFLEMCFGLGLFFGSAWVSNRLKNHFEPVQIIAIAFLVLAAVFFVSVMMESSAEIFAFLMAMAGVAFVQLNLQLNTPRVVASPSKYSNRVASACAAVPKLSIPLGIMFAGCMIDSGYYEFVFLVYAFVSVLGAALVFFVPLLKANAFRNPKASEGSYAAHFPGAFK